MNTNTATKRVQLPTKNTATKRTKRTAKRNTYVIEYPTAYLVITSLVKQSNNEKTGPMVQSYILDKDKIHEDRPLMDFGAKCSDCPLVEACYVNKDKLSVRGAVRRLIGGESTSYVFADNISEILLYLAGADFRFGSYGDPSAIPLEDIEALASVVRTWTGYTHFWRSIDPAYARYFMASVESVELEREAQALGYRRYRVLIDDESEVLEDSILCPHYTRGVQCIDCGLCKGASSKAKSIYAPIHGSRAHKVTKGAHK
jgi:hypothetical protein